MCTERQSCVCPDSFLCSGQRFFVQILLPTWYVLQECLFDVNIIFYKQKLYQTGTQQITAFHFQTALLLLSRDVTWNGETHS